MSPIVADSFRGSLARYCERMSKAACIAAIPFLLLCPFVLHAQGGTSQKLPVQSSTNFTLIPRADIETVQQDIARGTLPNDAPVRMVDISNRFELGVYTLNSPVSQPPVPGAPIRGFYHNDIAEIYIVVSGAGIWRVGGELENMLRDDPDDRSVKEVRGPGVVGILKGYTNQKISTGDVLIVPPGVPHSPGEMFENTKIIRLVIDPHKVLPIYPPVSGAARSSPIPSNPPAVAPKLEGTFTFISAAEIDKALGQVGRANGPVNLRTLELPAIRFRTGISVIRETNVSSQGAVVGSSDTRIVDLYYTIRGAGRLRAVADQRMQAGDILIAPVSATPVSGGASAGPWDILRISLDPDEVLPLK